LRGAVAAVDAACRSLGGEQQADAPADWALSRDLRLPWFEARAGRDLWRLSVPQTAPVLDLPDTPYVEWHGGQRWVRADAAAGAALRAAAQAVGGSATRFIVGTDASYEGVLGRFDPLPAPLDRIHRELKREFDPAGVFNPGRLSPDF
jgi:glycolate oxidase FAD binding subunit